MPTPIPFFSLQQRIIGGSSVLSSLTSRAQSPLSDSGDEQGRDGNNDLSSTLSPGQLGSEIAESIVISTPFNVSHPANMRSKLPSEPGIARKQWTDEQRMYASRAVVPRDSSELRSLVRFSEIPFWLWLTILAAGRDLLRERRH